MNVRRAAAGLVPVMAVVAALAVGAVLLLALGADPVEGYRALIEGAIGDQVAITATMVKAAPLLLVGAGICVAFRANVINIGGEGQIVAGALLTTIVALQMPDDGPRVVILPLVLLAGLVGGAIWGAIPGALKAYSGVNEILSTIMLNIVAVQAMNYLLRGPLIDPGEKERGTNIPQTERLPESTDLPIILGDTRLHLGVVVAVVAAVAAWFLLWRTTLGYRLRAVGLSRDAARYAGIPVERSIVMSMTIAGALGGLAGSILVVGSESHRFVTDGSSTGFTGSAGFNGIVAALFGALHPLWTIPSSFLFGGLLVGANAMQRAVQVPTALVFALNGLVVLFVVSSEQFRRRLTERARLDADVKELLDEAAEAGVDTDADPPGGFDPPDHDRPEHAAEARP